MKFVIALCLLVVVLVCHQAQGENDYVYEGGCAPSDVPPRYKKLDGCTRVTCIKNGAALEVKQDACAPLICEDGNEATKQDLSQVHPACCPKC